MNTSDLPNDPWAHRSEGMRCRTCMWFVAKWPVTWEFQGQTNGCDVGRCRRHAPTMGGYPVVLQSDWCGDHRLSERVRSEDRKRAEEQEMQRQEQEAVMAAALQSKQWHANTTVNPETAR